MDVIHQKATQVAGLRYARFSLSRSKNAQALLIGSLSCAATKTLIHLVRKPDMYPSIKPLT
jgi:hypothetical protein